MKTAKKILALVMALTMVFALAVSANAVTITINDDVGGSNYHGYKLLNLTTSPKDDDTDLYYAYSVNDTFRAVLESVTNIVGNDDAIIDYIESLDGNAAAVREFADAVYRAIQNAGLTNSGEAMIVGENDVEEGYWLIADVGDYDNSGNARSLVLLGTAGQNDLVISAKKEVPEVKKFVQEESTNAVDDGWGKSANYDIGDPVPFMLIGTVPQYFNDFERYSYTFHDTLSDGLTYDGDYQVYLVDDSFVPGNDLGAELQGHFTFSSGSDEMLFSCENIKDIPGVNAGSKIVVVYTATLNELAEIAPTANTNEVYLEFSNEPYGTGTGKTPEDEVKVFTYDVEIYKFFTDNEESLPLEGAGFTFWRGDMPSTIAEAIKFFDNKNGVYRVATPQEIDVNDNIVTELMSDADGNISVIGLDAGNYTVDETKVPEGYNGLNEPIRFTITDEQIDGLETTLTMNGNLTPVDRIEVENNTGAILPGTGGIGTTIFTIAGVALMVVAAVVLVARKKVSVKN